MKLRKIQAEEGNGRGGLCTILEYVMMVSIYVHS